MIQKGKRGHTGKARVPKGFSKMEPERLRTISRAAINKRWHARKPSPDDDAIERRAAQILASWGVRP